MIALGNFSKKRDLLDLLLKRWACCEIMVWVNAILFVSAEEACSMCPNSPRRNSNSSVNTV